MGFSTSGYDLQHDREYESSSNDVPTAGAGGETLPVWTSSRQNKLSTLVGSGLVNNSSFDIPKGVVDTVGYDIGYETNEQGVGVRASGLALNPDGKPLSGSAIIESNGVAIASKTTTGLFTVSARPPNGVLLGQTTYGEAFDFRFVPSAAGLSVFTEDIPFQHDAGTFQYGVIEGTITTYNGDPTPDVAVAGVGAAALTDTNGYYSLVAPGGSTIPLQTLYQSYDFEVDLAAGDTKTVDVQFPMLTIEVLDLGYEPVEGAPVLIDGVRYTTDSGGKVQIDTATVKPDYSVEVMDAFKADDIAVAEAGQEYVYTVSDGSTSFTDGGTLSLGGVKLTVVDAETQNPIEGIEAVERTSGVSSLSSERGVAKLLSQEIGEEADIIVGGNDDRYLPQVLTGTLPDNDMLELTVELIPDTAVVNS